MPQNIFRFKQFQISQNHAAQKIGTDSVLLGAYTTPPQNGYILDIGTGTGVLSLMIAQKCKAHIDAIDIDINAQKDAILNFENSKWAKQLQFHNCSLQEYRPNIEYDLIICNPPYFSDSLLAANESRSKARHTINLSFEELFSCVSHLLNKKGTFSVIIPATEKNRILELSKKYGLIAQKTIFIKPTPNKEVKRIIFQFTYFSITQSFETLILETEGRHIYSEKYAILMKDYLLKF